MEHEANDQAKYQKHGGDEGQPATDHGQHNQGEQGDRHVDHGLGADVDEKASDAFVAAQPGRCGADAGGQLVEPDAQKAAIDRAGQVLVNGVGEVVDLLGTHPFAQCFKEHGEQHTQGEDEQGGRGLGGDHAVVHLHAVERGGQGQKTDGQGASGHVHQDAFVRKDFGPDELQAGALADDEGGRHADADKAVAGLKAVHRLFGKLPDFGLPPAGGPLPLGGACGDDAQLALGADHDAGQSAGVRGFGPLDFGPLVLLGQCVHEGLQLRVLGAELAQGGLQAEPVNGFAPQLGQTHQGDVQCRQVWQRGRVVCHGVQGLPGVCR